MEDESSITVRTENGVIKLMSEEDVGKLVRSSMQRAKSSSAKAASFTKNRIRRPTSPRYEISVKNEPTKITATQHIEESERQQIEQNERIREASKRIASRSRLILRKEARMDTSMRDEKNNERETIPQAEGKSEDKITRETTDEGSPTEILDDAPEAKPQDCTVTSNEISNNRTDLKRIPNWFASCIAENEIKTSEHKTSFVVNTEAEGKKNLSETEINSLVRSSIQRARQLAKTKSRRRALPNCAEAENVSKKEKRLSSSKKNFSTSPLGTIHRKFTWSSIEESSDEEHNVVHVDSTLNLVEPTKDETETIKEDIKIESIGLVTTETGDEIPFQPATTIAARLSAITTKRGYLFTSTKGNDIIGQSSESDEEARASKDVTIDHRQQPEHHDICCSVDELRETHPQEIPIETNDFVTDFSIQVQDFESTDPTISVAEAQVLNWDKAGRLKIPGIEAGDIIHGSELEKESSHGEYDIPMNTEADPINEMKEFKNIATNDRIPKLEPLSKELLLCQEHEASPSQKLEIRMDEAILQSFVVGKDDEELQKEISQKNSHNCVENDQIFKVQASGAVDVLPSSDMKEKNLVEGKVSNASVVDRTDVDKEDLQIVCTKSGVESVDKHTETMLNNEEHEAAIDSQKMFDTEVDMPASIHRSDVKLVTITDLEEKRGDNSTTHEVQKSTGIEGELLPLIDFSQRDSTLSENVRVLQSDNDETSSKRKILSAVDILLDETSLENSPLPRRVQEHLQRQSKIVDKNKLPLIREKEIDQQLMPHKLHGSPLSFRDEPFMQLKESGSSSDEILVTKNLKYKFSANNVSAASESGRKSRRSRRSKKTGRQNKDGTDSEEVVITDELIAEIASMKGARLTTHDLNEIVKSIAPSITNESSDDKRSESEHQSADIHIETNEPKLSTDAETQPRTGGTGSIERQAKSPTTKNPTFVPSDIRSRFCLSFLDLFQQFMTDADDETVDEESLATNVPTWAESVEEDQRIVRKKKNELDTTQDRSRVTFSFSDTDRQTTDDNTDGYSTSEETKKNKIEWPSWR